MQVQGAGAGDHLAAHDLRACVQGKDVPDEGLALALQDHHVGHLEDDDEYDAADDDEDD